MSRLRHAGSPAEAPQKLSRARQDAILLWVSIDVRTQAKRLRFQDVVTHAERLRDVREALRLDDPVLDDLIAAGRHRGPWQSPTDAERVS